MTKRKKPAENRVEMGSERESKYSKLTEARTQEPKKQDWHALINATLEHDDDVQLTVQFLLLDSASGRGSLKGCVKTQKAAYPSGRPRPCRKAEEGDAAVEKKSTESRFGSREEVWQNVEEMMRGWIQERFQELLIEEADQFLGRRRSERRETDTPPVYRNGFGKPRLLSTMAGTIELKRPRLRGLDGRFESQLLPFFKRRTREMGELLPQLYLHGLAEGDFELALRGLLGKGAPLSASSIERLKSRWNNEFQAWRQRSLAQVEPVYLWADGVYVKAGLEKDKAAILVLLAALKDGRKMILAVESGHRESAEAWSSLLRSLKERGMKAPQLVIADGHLGIWSALAQIFPEVEEQRCWNHKIRNVVDRLPKRHQSAGQALLKQIPYAETRVEAESLRAAFEAQFSKEHPQAAQTLARDWERMVTFFRFPKEHWRHIRTTNPVESPFSSVRLRTDAGRRYKKVENATALIWRILLVAEKTFHRIDAPLYLPELAQGTRFHDGHRYPRPNEEKKREPGREEERAA